MPKTKTKVRLLPHETELLANSSLQDITHAKASSKWLYATSAAPAQGRVLCYRHMGDTEFQHLLETNQLPSTQPYQTLTREEEGRHYCESYLRSNKTVNTNPTTVVEFDCRESLIDEFYRIQSKIEEGTISHGLGEKAGKTLPRFNAAITERTITWRIVLVKRSSR